MQDMATALAMEIRQEFRDKHDGYIHVWTKAHFEVFPDHGEYKTRRAWETIEREFEDGRFFSAEANRLRLLVLANVLRRPIVVHSDEPFSDAHDAPPSSGIKVFEKNNVALLPAHLRGIYLPLLHPKPLLLQVVHEHMCMYLSSGR